LPTACETSWKVHTKRSVVRLFHALGLDVRRLRAPTPSRASLAGGLAQLARLGFQPHTVIDVGVANATPELYAAFPRASILLIEPLAEFEPFLKKICCTYNAEYVLAAAGEVCGAAVLHVHPDKVGSSLLCEVEGPSVDGAPRVVPVVTIDQLCLEKNLQAPYLLKADVQGAELQVLSGATRTLKETEVVILEVSLLAAMIGGPELLDIVSRMKDLGFVAYDLFGLHYRPLDNALCQVDMAFVPQHSPLRKSRAYATPEQRKARNYERSEDFSRLQRQLS
jgi:FkbM family methyltransferase